jgi:predicted amidohydrolase
MKVLIGQIGNFRDDFADNFSLILKELNSVVQSELPDLVIMPELWDLNPFDQDSIHNNAVELDVVTKKIDEFQWPLGTDIFFGTWPIKIEKKIYNQIIYRNHQGVFIENLRKHIPFGFGTGESAVVSPSNVPNLVFTKFGQMQVLVCFDLRFPELVRNHASKPDFLIYIGSWPEKRIDHWRSLLVSRAIENQAITIGCSSSRQIGNIKLGGNSMIVDPLGQVIFEMDRESNFGSFSFNERDLLKIRKTFPVLDYKNYNVKL